MKALFTLITVMVSAELRDPVIHTVAWKYREPSTGHEQWVVQSDGIRSSETPSLVDNWASAHTTSCSRKYPLLRCLPNHLFFCFYPSAN